MQAEVRWRAEGAEWATSLYCSLPMVGTPNCLKTPFVALVQVHVNNLLRLPSLRPEGRRVPGPRPEGRRVPLRAEGRRQVEGAEWATSLYWSLPMVGTPNYYKTPLVAVVQVHVNNLLGGSSHWGRYIS